MSPLTIAEAMCKDDPDYSPAEANPFATISKFRKGLKILEWSRSRNFSGSSGGYGGGYSGWCRRSCDQSGDPLMTSFNAGVSGTEEVKVVQRSQSLPSSPIMLRRAAEAMHQVGGA